MVVFSSMVSVSSSVSADWSSLPFAADWLPMSLSDRSTSLIFSIWLPLSLAGHAEEIWLSLSLAGNAEEIEKIIEVFDKENQKR